MFAFAFFLLGLLIGNLAGLSTAEITVPLVAALFAFVGGSAIAFFKEITTSNATVVSRSIAALAIGCLVGLYFGIIVREHRFLSPSRAESLDSASVAGLPTRGYLRTETIREADRIDQLVQNRVLSESAGYDSLYALIRASAR